MRTSRPAGRRVIAAAFFGGAIIAGATACSTSPSGPSASSTPANPSATASADPLAELTANQIALKAIADFKASSSVHVAGSVTDSGQAIAMNMTLGTKGCTGTLGIRGEGSLFVLEIGKTLWVKPDDQFWKSAVGKKVPSAVLPLFEGRYIQTSANDSNWSWLGTLCSPRQFAGQVSPTHHNVKGKTITISGQPVLQIKDPGGPGSAYVTISARPEILRIDGGSAGHMDFTGYNAPVTLTPPPADQTIDGAKLGF
jgi:hypothetical protein